MEDNFKSKPNYAERQIKLLLTDLANKNHTIKSTAVKRFQEYIQKYRPEVDV